MKTLPALAFAITLLGTAVSGFGQDKAPAERIAKIIDAHKEKMEVFSKKMKSASREEQRKLYQEEYPDATGATASITEIVKVSPVDEARLGAISWIFKNSRGSVDAEIFAILEKDHLNDEGLRDVVGSLGRQRSPEAEAFLKTASEKSEVKSVRGMAIYTRASMIERDSTKADEYLALLEKFVAEHSDLEVRGRNVADRLKGKLFAAKHLAIGKKAPEIIGKDVDGNEMKLSDYQGKIVVIDFWGDW